MQNEIETRIGVFRTTLLEGGVEPAFEQHIARHDCAIVGQQVERELRHAIAEHFAVPVEAITVVGSAKLGFSPKVGQAFKHFSTASDIDIAIVSQTLYSRVWCEVSSMAYAGEFVESKDFKKYHLHGWIRPDKLPAEVIYDTCRDWWDFFRGLSAMEQFMRMRISGGLYAEPFFFRAYQMRGLTELRGHLLREAGR